MRTAFFGTPAIAVPSLEALVADDDIDVVAAVTNPDRPRGRSREPVAPPVKEAAAAHDIEVLQPGRPGQIRDVLAGLALDIAAVVAYGAILPRTVLDTAAHGFVNLHFSLLPRWRGAAPVQHALRAGDATTGITTFVLDEGMDTGPILLTREVKIAPDETAGELLDRLAELGAPLLVDSLRSLAAGATPIPQPVEGATLAPKLSPEDTRIDWGADASDVVNLIRSAAPRPGAHTTFRGERLKVFRAHPAAGTGEPGAVVDTSDHGPMVACGHDAVVLAEVQPAGKSRMGGVDFANGYQPVGEVLDE